CYIFFLFFVILLTFIFFFFSSRRRHTRSKRDWSSDVCSSDLAGFEFENKIVGGVVPREYIPSVQHGIEESMENGVLAGYPLIDIKATLYDGSYHDVDSNEMAFKIAG